MFPELVPNILPPLTMVNSQSSSSPSSAWAINRSRASNAAARLDRRRPVVGSPLVGGTSGSSSGTEPLDDEISCPSVSSSSTDSSGVLPVGTIAVLACEGRLLDDPFLKLSQQLLGPCHRGQW